MKREGYLTEKIADPDNLRLAYWKAQRGKSTRPEVLAYSRKLDSNLEALRLELLSGNVSVGKYSYFRILDPKERLICAASFRERVLHHAIMNVCHPVFERFQTEDSYATRPGKGQYAALEKARKYTRRYSWFCKMDVRRFFDSIDHEVLYGKLCRLFKDPALLTLFRNIIDSYEASPGRGMPIGNLTSQYFANFYLGYVDHWIRENRQVPAYIRYMDDMVLWDDDKVRLVNRAKAMKKYIAEEFRLTLKPLCINSTDKGLPFLGYVLFPSNVRLSKRSKTRFKRKLIMYESRLVAGEWSQKVYARHILPLIAFARYAGSTGFRRRVVNRREAALQWGPTACCGVAAGTTTLTTAVQPIAITTLPATTTRIRSLASAWCLSLSSKRPADTGYSEPGCFPNLLHGG